MEKAIIEPSSLPRELLEQAYRDIKANEGKRKIRRKKS